MNNVEVANLNSPSEVFSWGGKSLHSCELFQERVKEPRSNNVFPLLSGVLSNICRAIFRLFCPWLTSLLSSDDAGNINFNITYNPINNMKQTREIFASVLI